MKSFVVGLAVLTVGVHAADKLKPAKGFYLKDKNVLYVDAPMDPGAEAGQATEQADKDRIHKGKDFTVAAKAVHVKSATLLDLQENDGDENPKGEYKFEAIKYLEKKTYDCDGDSVEIVTADKVPAHDMIFKAKMSEIGIANADIKIKKKDVTTEAAEVDAAQNIEYKGDGTVKINDSVCKLSEAAGDKACNWKCHLMWIIPLVLVVLGGVVALFMCSGDSNDDDDDDDDEDEDDD